MYYTITDKNSNLYNFPDSFEMESQTDENNINVINTAYSAGGRGIADRFIRPKSIVLSGNIQADTAAGFETAKRNFIQACLKGGDLRFTGDTVSRYLEVVYAGFDWGKPEGVSGSYQYIDVTVTFSAEKSVWKDDTETDDDNTVAGNDSFTISTTGTDYILKPVITIEADQAVDVPGVKITNTTDSGLSFTYNDSLFASGDTVIIDCAKGTVTRNNNNTIEYFDGAFIRLQPGSNSIEYEGAACTITFTFRKVYL